MEPIQVAKGWSWHTETSTGPLLKACGMQSISTRRRKYPLEQFQGVKPEIGLLFAVLWSQSEVLNGGLFQFLYNPTGVLAPEAATGLTPIGLDRCGEVTEEAMAFFWA